ncbi:MAG: trimeric intracellular cation channel family protein [Bacteroidetes bacterium]|nr:trimeric intracellular cation channel family protein [Bacteroidota bacterium]
MDLIYATDLLGTLVFAISGVLAATEKKFDLVGALVLGFVTAVGGGTLRDVLIGVTPVSWMKDLSYLLVILLAIPICYFGRRSILRLRKSLFLFDTIGIALFTILGLEKTLSIGLSPVIAVLMGVVSAVFGGIIRDVLSNEVPLIFRKEIYASACFAGGIVYYFLGLTTIPEAMQILISMGIVVYIRYQSVKRHWTLNFNPKS